MDESPCGDQAIENLHHDKDTEVAFSQTKKLNKNDGRFETPVLANLYYSDSVCSSVKKKISKSESM